MGEREQLSRERGKESTAAADNQTFRPLVLVPPGVGVVSCIMLVNAARSATAAATRRGFKLGVRRVQGPCSLSPWPLRPSVSDSASDSDLVGYWIPQPQPSRRHLSTSSPSPSPSMSLTPSFRYINAEVRCGPSPSPSPSRRLPRRLPAASPPPPTFPLTAGTRWPHQGPAVVAADHRRQRLGLCGGY